MTKSQVLREGLVCRKMPRRHLMGRLISGETSGCPLLGQPHGGCFPCACELPKGSSLGCKSGHVLTYPLFAMVIEEGRRHQNLNGEMVDFGLGQCWSKLWGDSDHHGDSVMCSLMCTYDYPSFCLTVKNWDSDLYRCLPHINTPPFVCASKLASRKHLGTSLVMCVDRETVMVLLMW